MMVRPGITIQHSREVVRDSGMVRSDITGLIGVVPRSKWPKGCRQGDYLEIVALSMADLLKHKGEPLIDPITKRQVQAFFQNGGRECRIFGVCVESQETLMSDSPLEDMFMPLLDRLRGQEDIGLLAMPILAYVPTARDRRGWPTVRAQATLEFLLQHCVEMNNRFLVIDTPKDLHDHDLLRWVRAFRDKLGDKLASYGAIYYPWLMAGDEMFPPSGSVTGIYGRVEAEHQPFGVHWPPANQEIHGVTHPAVEVKWRESGVLTEAHVNPILVQPSRGVVIWGARTLSGDPKWAHINSRRIVSLIAEQLRRDSEWVVFENQRTELWQIISRQVQSRLDQMWSAGLLAGDEAGSQYLVKCDAELNPPEVRNAGQVNVQVMVKPVTATEFIVVDLKLGI